MAPPPKRFYPQDFFAGLTSPEDIERTVCEFEDLLFVNHDDATEILDDLVSFERPEVAWILNRFPHTSAYEFDRSCTRKILSQLSVFFQFTPTIVIDLTDEERPVGERADKRRLHFRQLVKDAPDALAALAPKLTLEESAPSVNTKMSQKQMKQARRAAAKAKAPLDPGPFERLEIPIPETREDAEAAAYLKALHSPELEASIRAACVPDEPTLALELKVEAAEAEDGMEELQSAAPAGSEALYPAVQLMKFTRLYCDSATGFGEWAINISPRAERDLRDHSRRDRKIFKIILKKIKELSNGHFSPDNHKRLNGKHVEIPIYEAKMTGDTRLVYQIDCIPAYDTTSERQAIKIFGIYTHAQIGRVSFWDSMGRELGKKGKEYKDRCIFRQRPHHAGDHVFSPRTFPAPAEVRALPTGCAPDLPADDLEQMQSLLLKSVHFSQSLLDSIITGRDASFVLQVSPKEQAIIEHPHSCYVLGRSGTGKTTTMLYKMLLVEADYELSKEDGQETPKRRQLFVTQSRILVEKVEEHFSKLSAGYQPSAVIPDNTAKAKVSPFALVDVDDELNWRSDLPKRYSDLRDEHFPLFVTFDRLCSMLESDMEDDSSSGFISLSTNNSARDRGARPAKLTYDRFLGVYWPHFPQILTKGLDPSMVFSEFLGVIMGSEETLACASSYLDRATYLNLSERAQSTFADQRQRIYDLFEAYMNQKRSLSDIDAADRTHAILRYLEKQGVPGKKMDYLYVDETQDNLLVDTLLLRSICYNPNGLFWAGDTAQTISVGSSFRFNELKAFLYRIEQRRLETSKYPELYYQPVWQPRTFQLTVNYRSHAGIVNCAHTVIEVITMFWPYAIDVLDRERGTVDGLRPVFFTGFDSGNVQYEQFLFGDREGSYIEFGAQQCILVRDDAAREKLREQVGDIGLIMTLYESKGLEFNDVLLYNFFEDSTVGEAQWRVVLNALEMNRGSIPAPLFDKTRHAGVCVELKFLYVAITRARNNVWIADTSAKGEPMRILWTSRDQIQNCTPGTDTPRLAISSTAAEWEEQGRKLFANKRYRQAKHCFERALLFRHAAMAGAYYLRAEARQCPLGKSRQAIQARRTAFLDAAAAFLDCAKEEGTLAYFRIAAECFEDAGEDLQAADIYLEAKEYTRSTELYRKLGKFDEAVDIVQKHREDVRPEVVANVTNVARLYYFKEQKLEKANALFSSYEEALEYLEERGLDVAHATLLESLGRFYDAAEVHLEEGRTLEAIKLFLRDRDNEHSIRRGTQCILQSLWRQVSFAASPTKEDPSVSPLLTLAAKAEASFLSENERSELSMFQAICRREISKLQLLGEAFEATNPAAALLCLDHCFTNPPKIQALRVDGVAKELQIFFGYVKLLNKFTWADPCNQPLVEKLFGYIRQGENDFLIPEGTFLYSALRQLNHPAFHRSAVEENIVLAGSELRDVYHRTLKERLKQRVLQENEMCKRTPAFSPLPHVCHLLFLQSCRLPTRSCSSSHAYRIQFTFSDPVSRKYWISRLYSSLYPSFYLLGSASSLELRAIPEAEAGFQVVKEWVRSWVYDFEFFPAIKFLSNLAQVTRLSFQLDRKGAMSYLTSSPFMRMSPSIYLRPGGNYVVGEFLWLLEGKEEICISAGVLFVRHVVQNSLPIHISILCDILEHLCACIIIADRQQRGIVHDVTLPLSWLVEWTSVAGEGPRRTDMFGLLAQCLGQLLERLYSGAGAEHLLFENKNLASLGWRIRDTFFARMCRCICLLAYNSSKANPSFRFKILRNIMHLRRTDPNPRHLPLSNRYVNADSWSALVKAVRWSTAESPLDEMVVLLHAERPRPYPIRNVRQIIYKSREDIPQLLGTSRSLIESVSTQDVDSDAQASEVVPEDDDDDPLALEDESGFTDTGESEEVLLAAEPVAMPPALEAVKHTDEELRAASMIQQAFRRGHRRARRRKTEMAKSNLAAGCASFFAVCLKEAEGIDWLNKEYRAYKLRYLGPLPHLLLCLDVVHTAAQKQKKQIKKDLREAKHEKLEALDKQLTQLILFLKQLIEAQKSLGPTAAVHQARDLASLKSSVSTAVQLLRSLPFKAPEGLTQHLERAYKGIVQPKVFVQASARKKPVLNVDSLYSSLDFKSLFPSRRLPPPSPQLSRPPKAKEAASPVANVEPTSQSQPDHFPSTETPAPAETVVEPIPEAAVFIATSAAADPHKKEAEETAPETIAPTLVIAELAQELAASAGPESAIEPHNEEAAPVRILI
ncbi:UvrD-like helicase ATP-binding domain-containing protein [Mycena venus]|uniref:UvrD-like helicase ATP-binding domain-containing protein n=1 Tax=Mycena venus TaxID=2733690 RepID=A0A8H6XGT5_9AGAR|nr:UvrD-like helicase ATP-binding domain-containing protein [Mycena venus]